MLLATLIGAQLRETGAPPSEGSSTSGGIAVVATAGGLLGGLSVGGIGVAPGGGLVLTAVGATTSVGGTEVGPSVGGIGVGGTGVGGIGVGIGVQIGASPP